MMFMNEPEIKGAAQAQHDCPNVRKGVWLLLKLMQAVNAQSDGWPYWSAPVKAAEKLMTLLQTAGNLAYGTHGKIETAALRKAITPIRTMATHQKVVQAKYGNKFEFDVDEALRTAPA